MNVLHIAPRRAPNPDTVRDSFGQAAYAGLLPRALWIASQDLVAAYDAAGDDAERVRLAGEMTTMLVNGSDDSSPRTAA